MKLTKNNQKANNEKTNAEFKENRTMKKTIAIIMAIITLFGATSLVSFAETVIFDGEEFEVWEEIDPAIPDFETEQGNITDDEEMIVYCYVNDTDNTVFRTYGGYCVISDGATGNDIINAANEIRSSEKTEFMMVNDLSAVSEDSAIPAECFVDLGPGYLYSTVILGDVTGDGYVRANDARHIIRMAAGVEEYSLTDKAALAADTDADGFITTDDARTVLRLSMHS